MASSSRPSAVSRIEARLVERVADAFTRGLGCSSSQATPATLHEFAELLDESIRRTIPPPEWSFIQSLLSDAKEALQSSRQDRLEEARRRWDEVWTIARSRSLSLSLEGRLIIEIFLSPGYAYLYYKLEDYDGARRTIRHISGLDHRLVTEFGFVYLGAHRLQLASNLLRIHTRLGERSEAMQLGEALLDYLELRVEPPSNDLLCARTVLDSVPGGMVEYYFDKIAGELAVFLAGNWDAEASHLFQPLIRHAESERCLHGFAPRAHAWMRMKQLALKGETEAFLEMAIDLLQTGAASTSSLWFATVIEVVALCRSLGADASALADRMVADASALIDAPWELKQV
jgi:hypothetical protein